MAKQKVASGRKSANSKTLISSNGLQKSTSGTSTPTRAPVVAVTCKVCTRVLSGENFYPGHLQCFECKMGINALARKLEVDYSSAERAYLAIMEYVTAEEDLGLDYLLHKTQPGGMRSSIPKSERLQGDAEKLLSPSRSHAHSEATPESTQVPVQSSKGV